MAINLFSQNVIFFVFGRQYKTLYEKQLLKRLFVSKTLHFDKVVKWGESLGLNLATDKCKSLTLTKSYIPILSSSTQLILLNSFQLAN